MQIKSDLSLVLFAVRSRAALGPPNPPGGPLEALPLIGPAPKLPRPRPQPGLGPSPVPASRSGPLSRPASEHDPCLSPLPSGPRGRRCGRMDPGTGAFSEEQFREACAELQRPALSGAAWELLVETQGISVYRLLDQVAVRPQRTAGRPSAGGRVGGASGG